MLKDPELHRKYSLFMEDVFDKGHAQKVPEDQREGSPAWYLPHHPVIHQQKPDKVRVVFDCAAKFQNVSLNQQPSGKRPGGETGSPLLGECVMRRRTGTSATSALPVQ